MGQRIFYIRKCEQNSAFQQCFISQQKSASLRPRDTQKEILYTGRMNVSGTLCVVLFLVLHYEELASSTLSETIALSETVISLFHRSE